MPDQLYSQVMRRSFLRGGIALLTASAGATLISSEPASASEASTRGILQSHEAVASAWRAQSAPPVPPVIRSRQALSEAQQAATLPLTQGGTTYDMAQEVSWLDGSNFAVGRWDGSMSIFAYESAQYVGPLMSTVVNTPSDEGVQMITPLGGGAIATSNENGSLAIWAAPLGRWSQLRLVSHPTYDSSLGVATNGAWLPVGNPSTLVVGHDSGYLSLWSYNPVGYRLSFRKSVNLQNPNPVNPFGSHVLYGMAVFSSRSPGVVVVGSDDGYVSIVAVPGGEILSQTVFNPAAQRGINSVSTLGNKLLVSNCSVGPADYNMWYYSIQTSPWGITLLDKKNLIENTQLPQVFNFDAIWGAYSGGACWFASTEEGVLWMGTVATGINVIGEQSLKDRAVGAALAYKSDPGRLVSVIDDLEQFATGAA